MSIGKILVVIIFLSFLILFLISSPKKTNDVLTIPVESKQEEKIVNVNDIDYSYMLFISEASKLKLIANFDKKLSSEEISENNGCMFGINGSFYNEKWEPLAGWEANGEVRKDITHNNLLNGYVGFSNSNRMYLGRILPEEKMTWGMQTGPVLISNEAIEELSMATDKSARRSVVAITRDNRLVFLSIFVKDFRYDGPTMDSLPLVVKLISEKENFGIKNAVNLDGGSASAFYSPTDKLPELVAVGSWICAF